MMDAINIQGHRQGSIAVAGGGAGVATDTLRPGVYHVYSDVDVFLRVARPDRLQPNRAEDVGTADGYRLFASNVIPLLIAEECKIGVISASTGRFFFHRVG